MTLFQWIALTFLGLLLLWEVAWFVKGMVLRGPWIVRCLVWLAAALTIANPDLAQDVANRLGIQRGADLVFYIFTLGFLCTSFYFYSRQVRLQRQLTEVVRHVAVAGAQQGSEQPTTVTPA